MHKFIQILVGLEYLQRRRLQSLQAVCSSALSTLTWKNLFHVYMELPVFQFSPLAPCSIPPHHWKVSGPIRLTPILYIFMNSDEIPFHSSPSWAVPTLSPSLHGRCSRPLIILIIFVALQWTLSRSSLDFLNWEAQTDKIFSFKTAYQKRITTDSLYQSSS